MMASIWREDPALSFCIHIYPSAVGDTSDI